MSPVPFISLLWFGLWGPPATAEAPASAASDLAVPAPEVEADTVPLGDAIVLRPGATCLERERLTAQVRSWIDLERIDARLVVEVVGDPTQTRRLAFSLRRGDDVIAVRRFDPAPARCADLHSVVGLAIALAIDATLLENLQREPDPEPPPDVEVDPPIEPPKRDPPPVVAPPTEPRPKAPRPRAWALWSEITGLLSIGAPPGLGGGARFGLYGRWREIVDLGAGMVAQSSGAEPIGTGMALFSVAAGRVDVCAGPRLGRVRLRGCTGLIAGAALAAGQGFSIDSTIRVPWVAVPIGARLEARVADRFSVVFGAEGQIATVRPTFDATDPGGTRSTRSFARFAGALEIGLAILLW